MISNCTVSDVTKFDSFKEFSEKVSHIVGEQGLNVLYNNAGILLDKDGTVEMVTPQLLTEQFVANTVAPIMLTQVWPLQNFCTYEATDL